VKVRSEHQAATTLTLTGPVGIVEKSFAWLLEQGLVRARDSGDGRRFAEVDDDKLVQKLRRERQHWEQGRSELCGALTYFRGRQLLFPLPWFEQLLPSAVTQNRPVVVT